MLEPACAREFLLRGADPNATGPQKKTPLYRAIRSGRVELADLLVDYGAKVEPNLLFETVGSRKRYGDIMTKYLLDRGVDPNRANSEEFGGPLHLAVLCSKPHIIKMLLDAGADPTAPSSGWRHHGQTPEQILETFSDQEDALAEENAVLRLLGLGQAENPEPQAVC